MNQFYEYMALFETNVVVKGAAQGRLGKIEKIPVRNGRLAREKFGRLMKTHILTDDILVLDYYGFMKKSNGFWNLISETRKQYMGQQLKSLEVMAVHFASIRIEHVAALAPDLVAMFPVFKKTILNARGFKII